MVFRREVSGTIIDVNTISKRIALPITKDCYCRILDYAQGQEERKRYIDAELKKLEIEIAKDEKNRSDDTRLKSKSMPNLGRFVLKDGEGMQVRLMHFALRCYREETAEFKKSGDKSKVKGIIKDRYKIIEHLMDCGCSVFDKNIIQIGESSLYQEDEKNDSKEAKDGKASEDKKESERSEECITALEYAGFVKNNIAQREAFQCADIDYKLLMAIAEHLYTVMGLVDIINKSIANYISARIDPGFFTWLFKGSFRWTENYRGHPELALQALMKMHNAKAKLSEFNLQEALVNFSSENAGHSLLKVYVYDATTASFSNHRLTLFNTNEDLIREQEKVILLAAENDIAKKEIVEVKKEIVEAKKDTVEAKKEIAEAKKDAAEAKKDAAEAKKDAAKKDEVIAKQNEAFAKQNEVIAKLEAELKKEREKHDSAPKEEKIASNLQNNSATFFAASSASSSTSAPMEQAITSNNASTTNLGFETKESKEVKVENESSKDGGAPNPETCSTNNRSRS